MQLIVLLLLEHFVQKFQPNLHHSQSAPVLSSLLQTSTRNPLQGSASDQCCAMKKELLEKIESLSKLLPPNTLDELIDSLGGPEKVAEVETILSVGSCCYSFLRVVAPLL